MRFPLDGVRVGSLLPSYFVIAYCQFCLHLCYAAGSVILDIDNHLNSLSDVIDNVEYDNWQDNGYFYKHKMYNLAANNGCENSVPFCAV